MIVIKLFGRNTQNEIALNAMTLLRRYYLTHSLNECDPRKCMGACIVLGAKLSEVSFDEKFVEDLLKKLGIDNESRLTITKPL